MDTFDIALLVLRLLIGLTLIAHGLNHAFGGGKLAGTARWFEGIGLRYGRIQALASVVTEVGAGVAIALGLFTPLAGAAIIATMAVAGITAHRTNGFFAFKDGYEYVLFIAVTMIAVVIAGPGRASLDHALGLEQIVGFQLNGFIGAGIAVGLAVVGVVCLLGATYRPQRPAEQAG